MNSRHVSSSEWQAELTSFVDAVALVEAHFAPLDRETTALADAIGLTVASDVVSSIDVPARPSSTMDGYAIEAIDSDSASQEHVLSISAQKVMTGRPLPVDTNAVVPWEWVVGEATDTTINIDTPVPPGAYVRPAGDTVRSGQVVLASKTVVNPVAVGVLASVGCTSVEVVRRPRVGILSTGDELVAPGEPLADDAVYDVNSETLRASLVRVGATVARTGRVGDDPAALRSWLEEASTACDIIVTSGGASVGERDWMRSLLESDGGLLLWRVAVRPGKPFAFGRFRDTPVFVLPGNPASVLACFHAFVVPALRTSMDQPPHVAERARLAADVASPGDRTYFCPVRLQDGVAHPGDAALSATLTNHLEANAYAVIKPGGAPTNAPVDIVRFV